MDRPDPLACVVIGAVGTAICPVLAVPVWAALLRVDPRAAAWAAVGGVPALALWAALAPVQIAARVLGPDGRG